ncbi:MAG: glucose-1-phosphate cytidylyltransferase [Desulfovibrio sp.]|jgi:glucose-1-phosphate cytidylyltransferase|nr:glucose-1-phosphate cytidylyltransferase [Desulfovibrio sp.]
MKVILFCGGKGTRLREETEFKPKPMVEIGNIPIIWHIMQRYAWYGFKDFVLPLGYRGEMLKQYFYDYRMRNADFTVDLGSGDVSMHRFAAEVDWKITLCDTGENAEKGARIKRVARYLGGGPFMAAYGDGVADIDIEALVAFHKNQGKMVTFSGVRMPSRFGTVSTNQQGEIDSWQEKPVLNQFTNCGFFVFEPEFLDYLSEEASCDLEKAPLERLAREGQLAMYRHDGFWQCMDTLRDYLLLNSLWESGRVPWMRYPDARAPLHV